MRRGGRRVIHRGEMECSFAPLPKPFAAMRPLRADNSGPDRRPLDGVKLPGQEQQRNSRTAIGAREASARWRPPARSWRSAGSSSYAARFDNHRTGDTTESTSSGDPFIPAAIASSITCDRTRCGCCRSSVRTATRSSEPNADSSLPSRRRQHRPGSADVLQAPARGRATGLTAGRGGVRR